MAMNPRLLRPKASAPAAFSPASISGLFTWWDLSDSSTVTLNSGNVSAVADKSGSGNYPGGGSRALVQASAGDQPLYNATLQNGLGGAVFNEDGYLYSGATSDWVFLHHGTDRWSMFIAGETKQDSNTAYGVGHIAMSEANGSPGISLQDWNDGSNDYLSGILISSNTLQIDLFDFAERNRPSVFRMAGEPISGSVALSLTMDTGTTGSDSGAFSTDSGTPDYPLTFGFEGYNGTANWVGRLYEILIYRRPSALTSGEVTAVTNYLKAKWGIA